MTRRRPLVLIALAWALGVAFGLEFSGSIALEFILIATCLLFFTTVILLIAKNPYWNLAAVISVIGLAFLWSSEQPLAPEIPDPDFESIAQIEGVIESYPIKQAEKTRFTLRVRNSSYKIQYTYYHQNRTPLELRYGDLIRVSTKIESPRNFGDFDYQGWLASRGIYAVGSIWSRREIQVLRNNQGHSLLQWGFETRESLFIKIDSLFDEPANELLKSLLLGDRTSLDENVEQAFKDSGVMHVLAVSGLHLGILIGLFFWILRKLRCSFSIAYLLLIPLVILYLALVGFKISLVRASLMFAFMALGWVIAERGWILRKWIDPLQGLALAAIVILILTPTAIHDISFQLSFLATAGILIALDLFGPIIREWRSERELAWNAQHSFLRRSCSNFLDRLSRFGLISIAAQISVAPVLGFQFQVLHLAALGANLVVVPLAVVSIWSSLLVLALGFIFEPGAELLAGGVNYVLQLMINGTSWFASLPGSAVYLDKIAYSTAVVAVPLLCDSRTQNLINFHLLTAQLIRRPLCYYKDNTRRDSQSAPQPLQAS